MMASASKPNINTWPKASPKPRLWANQAKPKPAARPPNMAPQGLRWQGGVFAGPFRLQADASDRWTLVEQVPLERYLLGVVPHEIGAGSPPAALAAQAVLARTWALRNRQRFAVDGYHLCADTQCQVYGDPRQAGAAVREGARGGRGDRRMAGPRVDEDVATRVGGDSANLAEVQVGGKGQWRRRRVERDGLRVGTRGDRQG